MSNMIALHVSLSDLRKSCYDSATAHRRCVVFIQEPGITSLRSLHKHMVRKLKAFDY